MPFAVHRRVGAAVQRDVGAAQRGTGLGDDVNVDVALVIDDVGECQRHAGAPDHEREVLGQERHIDGLARAGEQAVEHVGEHLAEAKDPHEPGLLVGDDLEELIEPVDDRGFRAVLERAAAVARGVVELHDGVGDGVVIELRIRRRQLEPPPADDPAPSKGR